MIQKLNIHFILLMILLTISSCRRSETALEGPANPGEVTFILQMPGGSRSVSTYAITEPDENYIKTIDVFAFRVVDSIEYFDYKVQGNNIASEPGSDQEKQFTVKVKESNDQYRFVVLANCRNEVEALGDITRTAVKEEILQRIIFREPGKWNTSHETFRPFPMWGESQLMTVNNNTQRVEGIAMLRSVARIDVDVTEEATSIFKIESVIVGNYNARGTVVPNTSTDYWNNLDKEVLKPTIPDDPREGALHTFAHYAAPPFIREIYTAEVETSKDALERPCLIVGGKFLPGVESTTYYRIDFKDPATGKYLPLLRNHRYNINIIGVDRPGHSTAQEAFTSKEIRMTAVVSEWNESGVSDIGLGINTLRIEKSNYTIYNNLGAIVTDSVFTNVPEGWTATVDNTQYPWLTLQNSSGQADQTEVLRFILAPTTTRRTGIIKLKAGNLIKYIRVTQEYQAKPIKIINTHSGYSMLDPDYYGYSIERIYAMVDHMLRPELFGTGGRVTCASYSPENMTLAESKDPTGADILVISGHFTDVADAQNARDWLNADPRRVMIVMLCVDTEQRLKSLGLIEYDGMIFNSPSSSQAFTPDGPRNGKIMDYLLRTGPFTNGVAIDPATIQLRTDDNLNGGLTKWPSTMQIIFYKMNDQTKVMMGIDPTTRIIFLGNEEAFGVRPFDNGYEDTESPSSKFMDNLIAWISNVCVYGDEFTSKFY